MAATIGGKSGCKPAPRGARQTSQYDTKGQMKTLANVTWIMAAVAVLISVPAAAQVWDPTGNNQLNGTYYFREVLYPIADQAGDLSDAISLYGGITFNGNGSYNITGTQAVLYDAAQNSSTTFTSSGTYTIGASGHGFINFTNSLLNVSYTIRVLVGNGIVLGSSTDNQYGVNEMFIATPIASPQLTASAFSGSYTLVYFNPVSGSILSAYDALVTLNANGGGGIGTASVTGYSGAGGSSPFSVNESGVTYTFSGGAAVVKFPTSSNSAVFGTQYLYFSPDQNFLFGGAPNNADLIVGVRTGSAPNFGGFYYQAGLDIDESQASSGYGTLDSYIGSLSASNGVIVGHERLASPFFAEPYDYTYYDYYSSGGNFTDTDTSLQYIMGNGGVRIGFGIGPYLGLNVGVPAPSFTPSSGPYIIPTGVVNAASSAPFTAAVSPGELITIYGSGLAPSTQIASSVPLPNKLNGVQVLINNIAAPVYVVSANQVSAIVPYGITGSIAQVQVVTNGSTSNAVTLYIGQTSPGVFTNPAGGLGDAATLHADFSLVSPNSPAQPGETVSVFVTGLGAVFPSIADGAAGPSGSLSQTSNSITVNVDGLPATVTYAGLAPQLAALYQINFTIPSGASSGEVGLDIAGPDSYSAESAIAIGTGMVAQPEVAAPAKPAGRHNKLPRPRAKVRPDLVR
jgi:uncharacterized protein (TIGR03437 family)